MRQILKKIRSDISHIRKNFLYIESKSRIPRSAIVSIIDGGSIKIGERCQINHGVMILTYGGAIEIGDDCSINPYSILYGHGGLRIGNKVRIAAHCTIIPGNHVFADPNVPIMNQGLTCKGICIEDDVWVGTGVRILDGVRVARGTVVAAGAVVTKSYAPYAILAGVPARPVGSRGSPAAP